MTLPKMHACEFTPDLCIDGHASVLFSLFTVEAGCLAGATFIISFVSNFGVSLFVDPSGGFKRDQNFSFLDLLMCASRVYQHPHTSQPDYCFRTFVFVTGPKPLTQLRPTTPMKVQPYICFQRKFCFLLSHL